MGPLLGLLVLTAQQDNRLLSLVRTTPTRLKRDVIQDKFDQ